MICWKKCELLHVYWINNINAIVWNFGGQKGEKVKKESIWTRNCERKSVISESALVSLANDAKEEMTIQRIIELNKILRKQQKMCWASRHVKK